MIERAGVVAADHCFQLGVVVEVEPDVELGGPAAAFTNPGGDPVAPGCDGVAAERGFQVGVAAQIKGGVEY